MSFATSNRTDLKRIKEVTWGTTPASPALIPIRYTGESLDDAISTEKSKEIRSDRMVSDLALTDAQVSGDINIELSYGSFDDFFEAAFMSTWDTPVAITAIAGDMSSTASGFSSTLATKFNSIDVGQYVRVAGMTTPANNQLYLVTARTGTTLTTTPIPGTIETPPGVTMTVSSAGYLRNGVLEQSFTITEIFNDATVATRRNFVGMRVKGWSLDMKTASLLTGKFSFIGKTCDYTDVAFGGETTAAASTTDIMNCVTNVVSVTANNTVYGSVGAVMSLSVDFDNQHRGQKGIGFLGNVGVVASQLSAKGTINLYYESKAQALLFKAATAFSVAFTLRDNSGNQYVFSFPKCKYDSFKVNSSALDSDVQAQASFQALRGGVDPTSPCMVQLDRFVGP